MRDMENRREKLIEYLTKAGYLTKPEVIAAMKKVPRHLFVPPELQEYAYEDTPLHIYEGQTISAPHMVAMMLELLELEKGQRVLEVGTGTGYHAALAAELVGEQGHVYTIENNERMYKFAVDNLKKTGYSHTVTAIYADGSVGLKEHAPYDRIFLTCAAPKPPPPLFSQLKEEGILLIPVGGRFYQELYRYTKKGSQLEKENFGGCIFVPLTGQYGFRH
ncbi:MAG: protein-L-isoaspartate(D-aspartate) O-methyltransferase [Thermoplasmata archaeon]